MLCPLDRNWPEKEPPKKTAANPTTAQPVAFNKSLPSTGQSKSPRETYSVAARPTTTMQTSWPEGIGKNQTPLSATWRLSHSALRRVVSRHTGPAE